MMKSVFFKGEKVEFYPWDEPLIKAIDANDIETITTLLKEGRKPDLSWAFMGLKANNTVPKIVDLLAEHKALSEGLSMGIGILTATFLNF